ncbi:hypothetical protein NliqN6_1908 [Naganishia liquefaciens]|uniref:Macro domain-containing protein n=1 Tax=Naganishia liquefaciens TaxID=104408 RepID=A0A8H3TR97_9TREE|nr:hypothetical protein NliqN6_1908 [Naganishia liquefaciens]
MSSSTGTISLENIPTWYDHYRQGPPVQQEDSEFSFDERLNKKVALFVGDITKLQVDMIVNAANNSLLGGGGVDGAIHRAAGPELLKECKTLNGCDTGDVKITKGYKLPAKYVAHTVGPIYHSSRAGDCADKLESCYIRCMEALIRKGGKSIAFPSISCGVYGYPIQDATEIAVEAIRSLLETPEYDEVEKVVFCQFSEGAQKIYEIILPHYFPTKSSSGEAKAMTEGDESIAEDDEEEDDPKAQ